MQPVDNSRRVSVFLLIAALALSPSWVLAWSDSEDDVRPYVGFIEFAANFMPEAPNDIFVRSDGSVEETDDFIGLASAQGGLFMNSSLAVGLRLDVGGSTREQHYLRNAPPPNDLFGYDNHARLLGLTVGPRYMPSLSGVGHFLFPYVDVTAGIFTAFVDVTEFDGTVVTGTSSSLKATWCGQASVGVNVRLFSFDDAMFTLGVGAGYFLCGKFNEPVGASDDFSNPKYIVTIGAMGIASNEE